jgi:hypothetical protein
MDFYKGKKDDFEMNLRMLVELWSSRVFDEDGDGRDGGSFILFFARSQPS